MTLTVKMISAKAQHLVGNNSARIGFMVCTMGLPHRAGSECWAEESVLIVSASLAFLSGLSGLSGYGACGKSVSLKKHRS